VPPTSVMNSRRPNRLMRTCPHWFEEASQSYTNLAIAVGRSSTA